MESKIAQCRYCTNTSNEGEGIWRGPLWICLPCYLEFEGRRYYDLIKKEEKQDKANALLFHLIEEHWEKKEAKE